MILKAFLVGGAICVIGQLLIDYTSMTPARILVLFVTMGVVLTAVGLYEPLVQFAGGGATVPLTGFGYTLAKGVRRPLRSGTASALSPGGSPARPAESPPPFFLDFSLRWWPNPATNPEFHTGGVSDFSLRYALL